MPLKHEELSHAVIGCAMEVHSQLGPGLEESFYHKALHRSLLAACVESDFNPEGYVMHRSLRGAKLIPDLVINGLIIAEVKALAGPFGRAHWAQLINYLKFRRIEVGFLIDFGKEKLEWDRIVYNPLPPNQDLSSLLVGPPPVPECAAGLAALVACLQRVYDAHGLGYTDTVYRSLACADLHAEETPFQSKPVAEIASAGGLLGCCELGCIAVGDDLVLQIEALHERLRPRDRAIVQAHLKRLNRPMGLLANFGKRDAELRYVWRGERGLQD